MAEEFQARICGENWWSIDSTRSVFPLISSSSSPCSVDAGNYRQIDIMDLKETNKSCAEETNNTNNNLVSDSYLGFFDAQKPHKSESSSSASGSGSILIDSTLQMMGFGLNSSTSLSWNQPLLPERNFHSMLQEETVIDSSNSQIQRDWNSPKSFSSDGRSINQVSTFKPTMNQEFSLDQQQSLSSVTSTLLSSSSNRGNFPIGSASYGCPSMLMQRLYEDPDEDNLQPQPQPQQHLSLFTNRSMSYSSKANYGTSSNELSPIWSSKVSTFLKPSPIGKQLPIGLHFSNNTPFWNASAEALHDMRAGHAFAESTFHEGKPNCPSTLLNKLKSEESLNSVSIGKKNVCETALKRPRIETPSTFPTFKVRKEKLGDRVTALQQLVSPFGKTDTASVLHEAIEYIKFLHDQVSVLSTPYMKNGAPIQQKQGCEDTEGSKQDLRSRGLCLVPISSTFPVATETTSDLWTPTLGGSLLR
ncbi:Myc-type, basic helix-loop-helix [Sesbania bispinosa]|nr:Myc-type, basic helix-loop-helix [Sesbania bispinosa]